MTSSCYFLVLLLLLLLLLLLQLLLMEFDDNDYDAAATDDDDKGIMLMIAYCTLFLYSRPNSPSQLRWSLSASTKPTTQAPLLEYHCAIPMVTGFLSGEAKHRTSNIRVYSDHHCRLVALPASMDMYLHPLCCVGWNYLSIPKLQRLHRWSLGMDE